MTVEQWLDYLNKVDFTGVMQMGAPVDEHIYQAEDLHREAPSCKSVQDLSELLYLNFRKYWGPMANDKEQYETAAQELWPLLQQGNGCQP